MCVSTKKHHMKVGIKGHSSSLEKMDHWTELRSKRQSTADVPLSKALNPLNPQATHPGVDPAGDPERDKAVKMREE